MPYRIEMKSSAQAALAKIPQPQRGRIARKIDQLANNPRPHGAEKLAGASQFYRIRVGDYRIIYEVYEDYLVILVIYIGPRGGAY